MADLSIIPVIRSERPPSSVAGFAVAPWRGLIMAAVLVNSTFETMLVPALPLIRKELFLTPAQAAWVFSAFLLTAAVSLPIIGKLGDIHGPRRVLSAVFIAITVGVLLPAASRSYPALLAGQALQGLGMSLIPLGVALLRSGDGVSNVRSAPLLSAAAVSTAAGLFLAGIVLRMASYQALYWGALLPNAIIATASMIVLQRQDGARQAVPGLPGVDWLGGLLLGGALLFLLVGIDLAGSVGWERRQVIGLLVLASGLATLFIWRCQRVGEPLIEIGLLRVRSINRVAVVQLFSGFGTFATFVLVPILIQSPIETGGLARDASTASYTLAPFGICCVVGPMFVSPLRSRFGVPFVMAIGSIAAVAGPGLLSVGGNLTVLAFATGVLGFGIGMLVTQSFDLVGSTVPQHQVGSVGSLVFVLKMVGAALGGQAAVGLMGVVPSAAGFQRATALAVAVMFVSAAAGLSLSARQYGERRAPHQL